MVMSLAEDLPIEVLICEEHEELFMTMELMVSPEMLSPSCCDVIVLSWRLSPSCFDIMVLSVFTRLDSAVELLLDLEALERWLLSFLKPSETARWSY